MNLFRQLVVVCLLIIVESLFIICCREFVYKTFIFIFNGPRHSPPAILSRVPPGSRRANEEPKAADAPCRQENSSQHASRNRNQDVRNRTSDRRAILPRGCCLSSTNRHHKGSVRLCQADSDEDKHCQISTLRLD